MSRRYDPRKTVAAVPVSAAAPTASARTVRGMNAKVQLAPEEIIKKAADVSAPPVGQLDVVPQAFRSGDVAPSSVPARTTAVTAAAPAPIAAKPRPVPVTSRRVIRPGTTVATVSAAASIAPAAVPVVPVDIAPIAAAPPVPAGPAPNRVSKSSRVTEKIAKLLVGETKTFAEKQDESENKNPYLTNTALYIPPTRKGFYNFIASNYRDFQIRLKAPVIDPVDACRTLGSAAAGAVESFLYQKFIREYIRGASPYRGILVYHGLGSGKTCSAIAAAEALFSVANKRIIVMTPFSLRPNFINELMFCGFRHFNTNNFWIKQKISKTSIQIFAVNVMGIPAKLAALGSEIWIPDFTKPPNFNALSDTERTQIRAQIKAIIENRIEFINYNGVTAKTLKEWACTGSHFDNAVIVIDEVHNLTRLMQGTIVPYLFDRKKKGARRKVKAEPVTPGPWQPSLCSRNDVNYARGYMLYRMLVSCRNSKIIGLSGTPIINFPEELGILMNVLGGYIDCVDFVSGLVDDASIQKLRAVAEANDRIDLLHFSSDRTKVTLSVLKEAYLKRMETGASGVAIFKGVELADQENTEEWVRANETIQETWARFVAGCEAAGIRGARSWTPQFVSYPILPPDGKTFRENFLGNSDNIKYTNVLYKRLAGLISYYKGSKPEYMARVNRDEIVRCPFSEYSASVYFAARGEELEAEKGEKKDSGGDTGLWQLVEVVANEDNISSYRFKSRAACNFAFPTAVPRPFPGSQAEVAEDEVGRIEDLEVAEAMTEPEADMAAAAAGLEEDEEAVNQIFESGEESGEETGEDETAVASVGAAAPVNAPGIVETVAKAVSGIIQAGGAGESANETESVAAAAAAPSAAQGAVVGQAISYKERIQQTLYRLYERRADFLLLDSDRPEKRLETYSPKMAKILRTIQGTQGSALVYSQFKTLEGTGVFGIAMKANGWDEIALTGKGESVQFDDETIGSLARGPGEGRKRFILYTGDQAENRAIILNIFNGNFSKLPPQIAKHLEPFRETGNLRGELCKVFAISSAGAEGISLKNVRSVHIMEPYWNNARLDQVKGRAIRICSHADLPVDERNVDIYTYCASYPRDDKDKVTGKDLIDFQTAAADGGKTTDEFILDISQRKEKISKELARIMKESAVDCFLNSKDNEPGLACYKISPTDEKAKEPLYHPILDEDIRQTAAEFGLERGSREPVADARVDADGVDVPDLTEGVATPAAAAAAVTAPPRRPAARREEKLPLLKINDKEYLIRERPGTAGTVFEMLEPVVDNPRVLGIITRDILSRAVGLEQVLQDPTTDIVIY